MGTVEVGVGKEKETFKGVHSVYLYGTDVERDDTNGDIVVKARFKAY